MVEGSVAGSAGYAGLLLAWFGAQTVCVPLPEKAWEVGWAWEKTRVGEGTWSSLIIIRSFLWNFPMRIRTIYRHVSLGELFSRTRTKLAFAWADGLHAVNWQHCRDEPVTLGDQFREVPSRFLTASSWIPFDLKFLTYRVSAFLISRCSKWDVGWGITRCYPSRTLLKEKR